MDVSKMKSCKLITTALAFIFIGLTIFRSAYASELPSVALKPADVNEKIGKNSQKSLDLQALLSEMELSLTRTRKFNVLTRDSGRLADIREEQQFAQSDLAAGNAAGSGQLKNANYLILSSVQNFSFYRSHKDVPNLPGKYFREDRGSLEVQAQVLDTTTGGIKATFKMKAGFGTKRQMVNSRSGRPAKSHFIGMARKIAAQMSDQLIGFVFPMKVIKVKGDRLTINRGKDGGLKKGMKLDLFHVDEELFDPDTGESLGKDESYIGVVKVLRVKPKFSTVKIERLEEDELVEIGDILRKP